MEKSFGQAAYSKHFDAFMRHYLIVKSETGEIPNVRDVYRAFKKHAVNQAGDTRKLMADIRTFASHYCAMALGEETESALKQAFHDLRELKVDVAYPFLLEAYSDYRQSRITADELLEIVRMVESYVFRRAICAIPTNSMNRTFAGLARVIDKTKYVESVQAAFLQLPSYRRFPGDEEFEREIKRRDLYNFRSRGFWLRRLENHGRRERVAIEDYTIEHILPQNENLSTVWQTELGPDWQSVQRTYPHTLGNLTLTGYNSEYNDRDFAFKRHEVKDREGNFIGFARSPLKLNQGLAQEEVWNEASIRARADRVAREACKVWKAPVLSQMALASHRPTKSSTSYSIADHPQLAGGAMAALFQELRQQILGIDPCVGEEFLKLYVAYKAETNFVDVVPQTKRLRLSLNVGFHEIDDPKGICIDVTNLGRRGNGDVEVGLASSDQIPYVVGLIRQAFDRQMAVQ